MSLRAPVRADLQRVPVPRKARFPRGDLTAGGRYVIIDVPQKMRPHAELVARIGAWVRYQMMIFRPWVKPLSP